MLKFTATVEGVQTTLEFEHSLLSLSKWEADHQEPFLIRGPKKGVHLIDYFQAMLVTPGVDPDLVYALEPDALNELAQYINTQRTASTVPKESGRHSKEIITSELIYYWLVALKIPFHPTETWHLSRLMMLVEMTQYKNSPKKKRSHLEAVSDWRAISAANRERFNSKG